jgi:hypothetical protein
MAYATDLISDFYANGVSPLAVRMLVNHHTAALLLWQAYLTKVRRVRHKQEEALRHLSSVTVHY